MQVGKWGDSLAVRPPKDLCSRLGVEAGDALAVISVDEGRVTLARDLRRADAVARTRARKLRLLDDYRFDREAAHARGADAPETDPLR